LIILNGNIPISLVIGGNSRQESVLNSLNVSESDIVVIQDGARPMIKQKYINDSLLELNKYSGTSIAVKSKDTIKITDNYGIVIESTNRENTWVIQTPQCFDRKILLDAHMHNINSPNITDDSILLENMGYKVKLIPGDYTNIKITTKEELNVVKELIVKD
jgi:2-C-methyl-D-erythritol 4-phosphate cytidylyltransferase